MAQVCAGNQAVPSLVAADKAHRLQLTSSAYLLLSVELDERICLSEWTTSRRSTVDHTNDRISRLLFLPALFAPVCLPRPSRPFCSMSVLLLISGRPLRAAYALAASFPS